MELTATGSKARWAPQARRKACMGWSWAAACSVQGRGYIVAVSRLQLDNITIIIIIIIVCIVFGTDPPYFVVRPSPFYQRQPMQTVHLPCVAYGDPTPTIIWRRVSFRIVCSDVIIIIIIISSLFVAVVNVGGYEMLTESLSPSLFLCVFAVVKVRGPGG